MSLDDLTTLELVEELRKRLTAAGEPMVLLADTRLFGANDHNPEGVFLCYTEGDMYKLLAMLEVAKVKVLNPILDLYGIDEFLDIEDLEPDEEDYEED